MCLGAWTDAVCVAVCLGAWADAVCVTVWFGAWAVRLGDNLCTRVAVCLRAAFWTDVFWQSLNWQNARACAGEATALTKSPKQQATNMARMAKSSILRGDGGVELKYWVKLSPSHDHSEASVLLSLGLISFFMVQKCSSGATPPAITSSSSSRAKPRGRSLYRVNHRIASSASALGTNRTNLIAHCEVRF
jgi:hypothetical protein